ncbi:6597_t:CDS:2, partial [Funneliformis geosporum]
MNVSKNLNGEYDEIKIGDDDTNDNDEFWTVDDDIEEDDNIEKVDDIND